MLAVTTTAQDPDRHGNLKLSSTSAPNNNQVNVQLDWLGFDGNYYFIEQTNRLDEPFTPIQLFAGAHADGEGKLGLDLQTTAPKGFYRLFITDEETHPRLLTDDDGDKISNLLEAQAGWNAYEQPEDPTLDTDNDGLPDYWENFHFGNLDKDGAGDADGDGVSNEHEFSFGDNPQTEETERTTFSFQVTDNLTETRTYRDGGLFVTPLMRRTGQVSNSYRWDLKEAQHYTKHKFDVHEYADEYEGSGIDRDSFAVSYIYDIWFGEPDGSGGYLDDAFYAGQKIESSGSYSLTSFKGAPITMLVEHRELALEIITGDHTEDHKTIETGVVDYEVIHWDGQSLTIDGNPVSLPTQERGCIYPYGSVRLPFLVDLDIVHPATGELDEAKEDADTGSGIVAIKRDEETPVTELKIHAADSLPAGSKVYLFFTNGSGENTRYRIWKDAAMTDEIISSTTELDATIEHTLYIEGLKKSSRESGESIKQVYTVGTTAFEGDEVRFTVVEAEFDVWLNLFIPMQWTDIPLLHPVNLGGRKIAHGDERLFNDAFLQNPAKDVDNIDQATSSRVHVQLVAIPFGELDSDGIKDGSVVKEIGRSFNYKKSESVPFPDQGYSLSNLLFDEPVISRQGLAEDNGIGDPESTTQWIDSNQRSVRFKLEGSADNPIVSPSPTIDWDFEVGILVDDLNLLNPEWKLYGYQQDGFPAYEIYMRDSDGNNGDNKGTAVYQYNPLGFGRTPADLFSEDWWFADEDVTIAFNEGGIE